MPEAGRRRERLGFNLQRTQHESWPWMYGKMYWAVFEDARVHGIAQCGSLIQMLVRWTKPKMEAGEKERMEEILGRNDGQDRSAQEATTRNLDLLELCQDVADRVGAWDYSEPVAPYYDEPEDALDDRAFP